MKEEMILTLMNLGCICTENKDINNATCPLTGNQSLSLEMAQSYLGRAEAAVREEWCVLSLQRLDVTTKTPGGTAGCNQVP